MFQKSKDVLIFAKIYCNMKCIADILILFMIRDIKRLWLGGGYYGAPVVLEVTDTMCYRYVIDEVLYLRYGETVSDGCGSQVRGQYNATTNTITFLTGEYLNCSVLAEEIYHAYQQQYATFGITWNREFEAKVATILLLRGLEDVGFSNFDGITEDFSYQLFFNDIFTLKYLLSPMFVYDYLYNGSIFVDYYSYSKFENYSEPIYNVPNSLIDFFNKFIYEDN